MKESCSDKEQAENYDGTPIQIEFSACQSYSIPKFGKNEGQNIENLRIRLGIMQRDVFALMNEPRENQNTKVVLLSLVPCTATTVNNKQTDNS